MQVRRYQDATEFQARVEPYLTQDEAANNLPLGILSTILQTDLYRDPYMAVCERDGAVVGVALRTPPYNFILSPLADDAALDALAGDARDCFGTLPGVNALRPLAERFAARWHSLTGQAPRLLRAMRTFALTRVIPPRSVSGVCRPARSDELDMLIDWWLAFAAEALSEPMSREDAERMVRVRFDMDNDARGLRVWEDEGQVVSVVGYGGLTPHGIRIGPVYTPPERRGRGYASALTAAVSQERLDSGRTFVFLFTDLANPTSNHIYQTIGYAPVCDVDEFGFAGAMP